MVITQNQYATFREESIAKQPLRKTVLLSDLKFHTMDAVEYKGLMLGLNRSALKQIVRIVGFSMSGTDGLKGAFGEEGSINILNALKNSISAAKSIEVDISVSSDRVITHVNLSGQNTAIISTETYFDTVERIVDKHGLNITQTSFNPANGNVYIEAIAKSSNREFQIGNLSNEVFHSGISMSRTVEGLSVDPFLHRLVCTNGMVTRQFEESYKLKNMNQRVWEEFYRHLETIERNGFVPAKFSKKVTEAINTPASLYELEQGIGLISSNSNIEKDQIEMFIRNKHTYGRLHDSGIDTVNLTDVQKRNLRTGVSVWDVINGITDFASHNYGFEKKPNSDRHMQMRAGDILAKTFDSTNILTNQPF
jgi:hypothetical protein